ncbi:MAG: hypothetical protein E6K18_06895 [Methanobacteriota archaeon]|nr:MAG: hypothetical protein E6K18_06895 [Euryarchaeota archaeon]
MNTTAPQRLTPTASLYKALGGPASVDRKLIATCAVIAVAIAGLGFAAPASSWKPTATFPWGIASGDVTATSAVLWTRVDHQVALHLEVSQDASFPPSGTIHRATLARAEDDFTAKLAIDRLDPGNRYYYRWHVGDAMSPVGTFRTAPLAGTTANVRFGYSGDSDGTLVAGRPFHNNFETLADSGLRLFGPATTLSEYRDAYKVNRGYANLRAVLQSTSTYAQWDDHEVYNDFDAATVDPARYANGLEAFREYMPIASSFSLHDSTCRSDPMFRVVHWGAEADIIILDERSCRSAEAAAPCTLNGTADLAPTLPAQLRVILGLPASPPPGCLAAIADLTRTFLGPVQKAAFLASLQSSTARYKFVMNEDPIQQFFALPYDRWEGYAAERLEVLNFIRTNAIPNVVFLTTDTHAVIMNRVFVDRFTDPAPIAYEAITGPIATFTFEFEVLRLGGPSALAALQGILTFLGVDCRNLNVFSYGVVDVDPATGRATITMKDGTGAVVHDQVTPAVACTTTLGP